MWPRLWRPVCRLLVSLLVLVAGWTLITMTTQYYPKAGEKGRKTDPASNLPVSLHAPGVARNVSEIRTCSNEERLTHLRTFCRNYRANYMSLNKSSRFQDSIRKPHAQFVVDESHEVMYCYTAKVASSTWKSVLLAVAGNLTLDVAHRLHVHVKGIWRKHNLGAYGFTVGGKSLRYGHYFKFLTVRHPLERFLSVFEDKIRSSHFYYTKLVEKLFGKAGLANKPHVTLSDFVTYMQMVGNPHWDPQYSVCNPCAVDWSAIVRVETIRQDAGVVLERLAPGYIYPPLNLPHIHAHSDPLKQRPVSKVLTQLSELSRQQMQVLYDMYELDMAAWGYGYDPVTHTTSCRIPTASGDDCC